MTSFEKIQSHQFEDWGLCVIYDQVLRYEIRRATIDSKVFCGMMTVFMFHGLVSLYCVRLIALDILFTLGNLRGIGI